MKKIFLLFVAVATLSVGSASAQGWLDALKGAATTVVDKVTGGQATQLMLPGTWSYNAPAMRLTSEDNLLADVASSALVSGIEDKLVKAYSFIGIKQGSCTFTFNTDDVEGDETICTVSYRHLPRDVKRGNTILLDDGLVSLKVLEVGTTDIKCKIERGKNRFGAPCTYARYYIGECVDTFKTETVDRVESSRSWLTEQQYKVLAGLVNAGDVRGASLGLEKLKRRYEKERKNASA